MSIQRLLLTVLVATACLGIYGVAAAHGDDPHPHPEPLPAVQVNGAGVHAACAGGPVIDGGEGRRFMAMVLENFSEPALFLA